MSALSQLSTPHRAAALAALSETEFDCLVIGGGITGAGVAREAARRGLSVALVEADDFASGTSSRSSKLIHGGLRYLALGDVGLVRETALERKHVRRIAPHLAEPGWMVMPTRSRASMLKFRAAVAAYEKLGAVEEADRHSNWGEAEIRAREPLLRTERFPYAIVYREYLTDDARLVLANLRAASADGAVVLNHAPATALLGDQGRARGAVVRCALSDVEVEVRARCIVNAAGPWVESVQRLENPQAPPLLHLSKGVHLVFARERLPVQNFLVMGTQDKRAIFAIARGDAVYVGTTDTSYGEQPERWPAVTRDDVHYLLAPLTHYLDVDRLQPEDCLAVWAGLRPLVAQPGKAPAEISRRDEITVGAAGVVTIAGGKLTGYRKMAASVLDRVGEVMGRSLPAAGTAEPVLPGGDFDGDLERLAAEICAESAAGAGSCASALPAAVGARLARLYGSEAHEVLARGAAPLVAGGSVVGGEIDWAVRCDGAATLLDVLDRRLRATLYLPHERDALVEPVARALAELLGWDAERTAGEIGGVRARIAADLAFRHAS